MEQRERWIEKDGTTAIELRVRRQPSGGGKDEPSDASERAKLSAAQSEAQEDEQVPTPAWPTPVGCSKTWRPKPIWRRALLNVVRNKGAPGVDGQTVEAAEAKAPSYHRPFAP